MPYFEGFKVTICVNESTVGSYIPRAAYMSRHDVVATTFHIIWPQRTCQSRAEAELLAFKLAMQDFDRA